MQACVYFFDPRSGTGSQNVPNIVDRNGTPFRPKVNLTQSCFAAINTLTAGAIPIGGYSDFRGVDTGTIRSALTASDAYSGFNFKAADTGVSFGDHSLMDVWSDNFGQAQIYRAAKIASMNVGSIDWLYDLNLRNGDTVMGLALGGDDFDFIFTNTINGTYATPAKPQGVLAIPTIQPAASGATTWGTGGHTVPWGWATRNGNYGTAALCVVNQGQNWSAQRSNGFSVAIDFATGAQSSISTISAWTDTDFTLADGPASAIPMAICGADLVTAGGHELQPIANGVVTYPIGIDADVIFFGSIGQVVGTGTYSDAGQYAMGWATPTSQGGFWSGEATVGNTPPQKGARYLSNNSVLRFGTPNGLSTSFGPQAAVVSIDPTGFFTLNWTNTDATLRGWWWFAIGRAAAPPPSIGMLLTQLPIEALYPYQAVSSLAQNAGVDWFTPPPTRSRRGR